MKIVLTLAAVVVSFGTADAQINNYTVSNIVTSTQDSRLVNPWGISRSSFAFLPGNDWWVSDQVTGLATTYAVSGRSGNIQVSIPTASGTGIGSPTGTVFNPANFTFAFATLDGTISVWSSPATSAIIKVNNSGSGASYQGLTIAINPTTGKYAYYAANANGGVEVYDATTFNPLTLPAGAFADNGVPSTYSPAGIQAIAGVIFVTYNAIAGGGTGYVDAYDRNGRLLLRLQNGWFNQPWGVALTPSNFGKFSSMILVGNTGSGWIGAYKLDGAFQGFLQSGGQPVTLPGLWGLEFGDNSLQAGPANVLYFAAGGPNLTTGVFGAILPH